jgi:pSer/pThr/pTyr-binding forkhead associated (FHA) protein
VATLEVYDQFGRIGRTITLSGDELSIGRHDDNDLVIKDGTVSNHHALLERHQNRWTLRDLKARNGTSVNGVRIVQETLLQHKDEVVVGKTRLVYLNSSEARGTPTNPLKPPPELARRQREVLVELCRPVLQGGVFVPPASDSEIGAKLFVGEAAVRMQLGELYRKFEIDAGQHRRARLAQAAIDRGAVTMKDFGEEPGEDDGE